MLERITSTLRHIRGPDRERICRVNELFLMLSQMSTEESSARVTVKPMKISLSVRHRRRKPSLTSGDDFQRNQLGASNSMTDAIPPWACYASHLCVSVGSASPLRPSYSGGFGLCAHCTMLSSQFPIFRIVLCWHFCTFISFCGDAIKCLPWCLKNVFVWTLICLQRRPRTGTRRRFLSLVSEQCVNSSACLIR